MTRIKRSHGLLIILTALAVAPVEVAGQSNGQPGPDEISGYGLSVDAGLVTVTPQEHNRAAMRAQVIWPGAGWRMAPSLEIIFGAGTRVGGRMAVGLLRSLAVRDTESRVVAYGDIGPTLPVGVSAAFGLALEAPAWGGIELQQRLHFDRNSGLKPGTAVFFRIGLR